MEKFDVVIVGAGIIGAMIAYELSPYELNVLVIDKNEDVAAGITKANSAIIHAGYDPEPGTLKAQLNARGNHLYDKVSANLGFDLKRIGSFVLASTVEEENKIYDLHCQGKKNGVVTSILDGNEIRKREPNVSEAVTMGLFAPSAAIVAPWDIVYAALNHSVLWGAKLHLSEEVVGIKHDHDQYLVKTSKSEYQTRFLINAAGHGAVKVHSLLGLLPPYESIPTRGQYYVIDRGYTGFTKSILFPTPSSLGKGVLAIPTVHGNYLLGPTSEVVATTTENGITREGVALIKSQLKRIVNNVPYHAIIRSFAGVRPKIKHTDFVIEESVEHQGYIWLFGIDSPGLASAPAIAEYVVNKLPSQLLLKKRDGFYYHKRKMIGIANRPVSEINRLIKDNPLYGQIVCRCEQITQGEIIDAINEPIGARTIDGVKRRVRPGSGRCQGGFCQPIVLNLLAMMLKKPKDQIVLDTEGSNVLCGKIQEDLIND